MAIHAHRLQNAAFFVVKDTDTAWEFSSFQAQTECVTLPVVLALENSTW